MYGHKPNFSWQAGFVRYIFSLKQFLKAAVARVSTLIEAKEETEGGEKGLLSLNVGREKHRAGPKQMGSIYSTDIKLLSECARRRKEAALRFVP